MLLSAVELKKFKTLMLVLNVDFLKSKRSVMNTSLTLLNAKDQKLAQLFSEVDPKMF